MSQNEDRFTRHHLSVGVSANEFFYIQYEYALNPKWSINTGLGISKFLKQGNQYGIVSIGSRWYFKESCKGLTLEGELNLFTSEYYPHEGFPVPTVIENETRYNFGLLGKTGYTFTIKNKVSIYPYIGFGIYRPVLDDYIKGLKLEAQHLIGLQIGLRL